MMKSHTITQEDHAMGRTGRFGLGFTLLACALTAIVLLPGCGTSPVAPDNDTYTFDSGVLGLKFADSLLNGGGGLAAGLTIESDAEMVTIGKGGGTIELRLGKARSFLKIPKGALSTDTEISAAALQFATPWGGVTLYDFHPDGLVFNKPAELTLEVKHIDNGVWLRLYWYNPDTGRWEFQQESEVRKHKVKFSVYHFSKYGIT